jgi:uncharacterized membrane protein YphA (DoxX/SURF4 family)
MNIALLIVQVLLAAAFIFAGVTKAFRYEHAHATLPWVKDVPRGLTNFIGVAELLGGLGLLLPALTGILPWLTPLAATGLALVMLLAAGFHFTRKEWPAIGFNTVLLLLAAFVAYGRFVVVPV